MTQIKTKILKKGNKKNRLNFPKNYTHIASKLEEATLNSVDSIIIIQLNLDKKLQVLLSNAAIWGYKFYKPEDKQKLLLENQKTIDRINFENMALKVNFFLLCRFLLF